MPDKTQSEKESVGALDTEDWNAPKSQGSLLPTYAPAVTAAGIVCLFWGFITTFLISLLGFVLVTAGLAIWIGELRHE